MRPLRVGLVSSVGGHLAELMELQPVLAGCDLFWVLNDAAPWQTGTSLGARRTYRIVHAERDVRQLWNLVEALPILAGERPDVLISTGASPAVPFFGLGRLLGACTLFIETFAAVDQPSLTGRLIQRLALAEHLFVQWPELLRTLPRAQYCGPIFVPHEPLKRPPDALRLLVTVGTSPRPFNRLLTWLDRLEADGALPHPLLVQTQAPAAHLRRLATVPYLTATELDRHIATAERIVCHGGAGVLGSCLKFGRHAIVVPRRAAHGEHVNDHQLMLCQALAARGLITLCESEPELAAALKSPAPVAPALSPLPTGLLPAVAELLRAAARARGRSYG